MTPSQGVIERWQGYAETNFEPGRCFANELDFQDQLDAWTVKVNARTHRTIRARPVDRLAEELAVMAPLPAGAPDTDRRWVLRVPADPYLRFDTCDYSLDPALLGRRVEVRVSAREVTAVALDSGEIAWSGQLGREGLGAVVAELSRRAPDARTVVKRTKRAAACSLWITGLARADLEDRLMRHHRDRDAAGAVEAVAARTSDLVTVVGQVVDLIDDTDCSAAVDEARLRLSFGIPGDLVDLAACCGRGLSRSQYLRLRADGLGTVAALAGLDEPTREARLGRELSDRVFADYESSVAA